MVIAIVSLIGIFAVCIMCIYVVKTTQPPTAISNNHAYMARLLDKIIIHDTSVPTLTDTQREEALRLVNEFYSFNRRAVE